MSDNFIVVKSTCAFCGKDSSIILSGPEDLTGWSKWIGEGAPVQVAFPHWDKGKRETMQSGLHSSCYDDATDAADICKVGGHDWPSDLTPDAVCGECGLVYSQWSVDA